MTNKLKPCPFCGDDASLVDLDCSEAQISCSSCGARTRRAYKPTSYKIVDNWNNRSLNNAVYDDLKACPFCGNIGKIVNYNDTFIVQCSHCSCGTDFFPTPDEAKAAWNNRAN